MRIIAIPSIHILVNHSTDHRLDIVVPCYNPQKDWVDTFIVQFQALQNELEGITLRCLLVNDGSTQNVAQHDISRLKEYLPSLQYISYDENRGKGYAIRKGMQSVESDISAFTDIDFPYEPQCLRDMYKCISEQRADMVTGHRTSSYYDQIPLIRRWLSYGLQQFVKYLMRIPVKDTQGGLKAFNKKGLESLLQTTLDRYLFDIELIKIGHQSGLRIQSIPLNLRQGFSSQNLSLTIVLHEIKNFIKLLLK